MKLLFGFGIAFLLIAFFGCSEDPSTGPGEPQQTSISINNTTPGSPAILKYYETATNDRVSITYNYSVAEAGGARIWIQPVDKFHDGKIYYNTSPIYTGSGNKTVVVSVASDKDTLHITQLRIIAKTPDQSSTLYESFVDVDYTFTK